MMIALSMEDGDDRWYACVLYAVCCHRQAVPQYSCWSGLISGGAIECKGEVVGSWLVPDF